MRKKHFLTLFLGLSLQFGTAWAETQTFDYSEQIVVGAHQTEEEVRMLAYLHTSRLAREQAVAYVKQKVPALNAQLKPEEITALIIALFQGDVYELKESTEIKTKIFIDTSLIPEDIPAYLEKNPMVLTSIIHNLHRVSKLEDNLERYLQDLSRATGAQHALLIRETRGEKLKNQYKSNRYFVEGADLFGRARWQDALDKLDKAISLDPEYTGTYLMKAVALFQLKDHEEALKTLNKGLEFEPQSENLLFMRGVTYVVQGVLLNKGLDDLNQTLAINPQNSLAYYLRGSIYKEQGQCSKAKQDFYQACQLGHKRACMLDCTPKMDKDLLK